MAAAGLDLGLAFDGDADRLIAVDERGQLVDGDAVMGICALERLAAGTLRNSVLVATVMSNGGLERAVRAAGGRMVRTPVGDRHVFEAMERDDAVLGGEQSGHIIFRDRATTGDGLLTGIELVRAMRAAERPLSELAARIPRLPQVVINSAVRRRDDWQGDPEFDGRHRAGHDGAWGIADGCSSARPAPSPRSGSWSRATMPARSNESPASSRRSPRHG